MKSLPVILAVLIVAVILTGRNKEEYKIISQDEAKAMMDNGGVTVIDVREQDEYDSGHIKSAVLLPLGTITADTAEKVIESKDTAVLVYCRSGNRSKKASAILAKLGYKNIYEIGGITSWPYGVEY